ncbi:hypothetical protein [Paraburkholderia sp. 40]|uniref:hypothetical protein n=1 Tax=unclassified Paraburkholderia TaxID=2615204 RepID=UPI003D1D3204
MAFDNLGFITLGPAGGTDIPADTSISINLSSGADSGAQFLAAHLVFGAGTVMADRQAASRWDDGTLHYRADFHNLERRAVSFTLTGGGLV